MSLVLSWGLGDQPRQDCQRSKYGYPSTELEYEHDYRRVPHRTFGYFAKQEDTEPELEHDDNSGVSESLRRINRIHNESVIYVIGNPFYSAIELTKIEI